MNTRELLDDMMAQLRIAKETTQGEEKELTKARQTRDNLLTVREILNQLTEQVQNQVHSLLSHIVTKCLDTIYEPGLYEFRLTFKQKRGKTEPCISIATEGRDVDPLTESGGGIVDVVAFALRLTCLTMITPKGTSLFLDEPFKFVSEDHRLTIKHLLTELSEQLNVQFVLVTHISELEAGVIIQL